MVLSSRDAMTLLSHGIMAEDTHHLAAMSRATVRMRSERSEGQHRHPDFQMENLRAR